MEASKLLIETVTKQINKEDVANMIDLQNEMLKRFEKTNEMLLNFNNLSSTRFKLMEKDWKRHVQLLANSKKDLEIIFKRIRQLKYRLSKQYPQQFQACSHKYEVSDDEYEESMKTPTNKTQKSIPDAPVIENNSSDAMSDVPNKDNKMIVKSDSGTNLANNKIINLLDSGANLSDRKILILSDCDTNFLDPDAPTNKPNINEILSDESSNKSDFMND